MISKMTSSSSLFALGMINVHNSKFLECIYLVINAHGTMQIHEKSRYGPVEYSFMKHSNFTYVFSWYFLYNRTNHKTKKLCNQRGDIYLLTNKTCTTTNTDFFFFNKDVKFLCRKRPGVSKSENALSVSNQTDTELERRTRS